MKFKKVINALLALVLCFSLLPGIPVEAAGASTAKVYKWKQTDSRWNTIYPAKWSKGCAVTAIAIQIARTDLVRVDVSSASFNKKNGEGFNPGSFAKAMKLGDNLAVNWDVSKTVSGFKVATDSHFRKASDSKWNYYPADSKQAIVDAMAYFLEKGYYPIIEGPGSRWGSDKKSVHYVAVIKTTDDDVRVVDPADGKEKSLFSISLNGNKWSPANIDKCGKPKGYGCCRLYKVDESKLLETDDAATADGSNSTSDNVSELDASAYLKRCESIPTYCILKANLSKSEYIKSLPCSQETNKNSETIRQMEKDESFTAVALIKNTAGNYWYAVDLGNGKTGYMYAGATLFVKPIEEDPTFNDAVFSKTTYGKSLSMKGHITSQYTLITEVSTVLTDSDGKKQEVSTSTKTKDFVIYKSKIDSGLKFGKLSKGDATITFSVELTVYYSNDGKTISSSSYTKTHSWDFNVV
ncbi:MAG: hypothetical protein IKQ69_01345 [Oscillospiraceae bacterium]|nr:hypothetical protein [Oscillospiraceae bacterium]